MALAGFIDSLTTRGAMPALEATLQFTHARHKVIAGNVANATTPGYRARRLEVDDFHRVLGRAMDDRGPLAMGPLKFGGSKSVRADSDGRLRFAPTTRPARNALFYDGTNVSIEREMSDMAANAMLHEVTTNLLRGRYDGLQKAIRGQV